MKVRLSWSSPYCVWNCVSNDMIFFLMNKVSIIREFVHLELFSIELLITETNIPFFFYLYDYFGIKFILKSHHLHIQIHNVPLIAPY